MNKLFQSVALVQRNDDIQTQWLLRWCTRAKQWEFIVGDRLNDESFRETITREVAWQLNLDRKAQLLVSNMAQLSMEYVEGLDSDTHRHVAVSFYNVHIYGRSAERVVESDPLNRWLTSGEICKGQTRDGQTIHPRVVEWINKWNVVQPWQ